MMATVMLEGLAPVARELNDRLARMGGRLDEAGSIDLTDGSGSGRRPSVRRRGRRVTG